MQYLITFLEGIISFISPCMLPLLPIYISYFAGGAEKKRKTFINALGFVLGFTTLFCVMGMFAGVAGSFLNKYQTILNIVCGVIVIIFGLTYLEVIRLPFFKGVKNDKKITGFFSAFVFGLIYSVSLTPCVGAFLGSALMLAADDGSAVKGSVLLLIYSLGMGIPFLISAVLIEKLSTAFNFIKKHYKVINLVCGIFLIIIGILMATGLFNKFLKLFN